MPHGCVSVHVASDEGCCAGITFHSEERTMKIVNWARLFVGLDYHQDFVQVCELDEAGKVMRNSRVENDWRKIAAAVPAGAIVQVALEACCGAADLAGELAERAGWRVSVAHPGVVVGLKQNPDKTDYSDARLLADLLRRGCMPKHALP